MSTLSLRCVQLDLARQMEPVSVIKEFIRMAADNGYNGVLLYLEDRIRTASYPYPAANEAYSEDEIRELVQYGTSCGIELIPCVATLGHAERFLRHPELAHLSEAQDGKVNRFGVISQHDVFCISNPAFYSFIERYLHEVAALFPSKLFHVGLDEFFDFNLCEKCRLAMPTLADEEQAFLDHIVRIRKCMADCGKRIMMWSDMLEIYTTVMERLPQDVILVDWLYNEDSRQYLTHLLDMTIENRPKKNISCGLSTIIAPSDHLFTNASSLIHAASNYNLLGFLMTTWEKSDTYLLRSYPVICYSGRLANGESNDDAWTHTVEYLFGCADRTFANVMKLAQIGPLCRHFAEASATTLFSRPFAGILLGQNEGFRTLLEMVIAQESKITTELGHRIWLDTVNMLEEKVIKGDFKETVQDIVDFGFTQERMNDALAIEKRFTEMLQRKHAQWEQFRTGITPNIFDDKVPAVLDGLRKNLSILPTASFVRLRCALIDQYVVNYVRIEVQDNAGQWQTITERSGFKADELTDALFEYAFPYVANGTPAAIKIETWGMGARGFAFAEVRTVDGDCFVPAGIEGIAGIVEHPECMLENNGNVSWFGEQSTRRAYHNLNVANTRHTIILTLKQK